jgi:hypothetical protein
LELDFHLAWRARSKTAAVDRFIAAAEQALSTPSDQVP